MKKNKDRIVQIMMVNFVDTDNYDMVENSPVLNGMVGLSASGKLYRLKHTREKLKDVIPLEYGDVRRWEAVGEIGIE